MSTAPKELREVDMTAKMSKSKKKKLKKRAKRNQALMAETMQHIEEVEKLEKSEQGKPPAPASSSSPPHPVNGQNGKAAPAEGEEKEELEFETEDASNEDFLASSGRSSEVKVDGKKLQLFPLRPYIALNSDLIIDIEKRKSFADMKLAVVASGGQEFNFDKEDEVSNGNGNDSVCNGHENEAVQFSAGAESPENENGDVSISNEQGEGSGPADDEGVTTAAADEASGEAMLLQNAEEGEEQARKPDPVHEVCPNLEVKIADLGNACWVVRLTYTAFIS